MRKQAFGTPILATILLGLTAAAAVAQQRPATARAPTGSRLTVGADYAGPMTDLLKIRRLEGIGRQRMVRTPEYRHSLPGASKPSQEWVEIRTLYDTTPEWIDEVVFQYYVMTRNQRDTKAGYSFYQASVRYGDVERGPNHISTVYIPPSAVKRYGIPVAIGVEVLINGKMVDNMSEVDPSLRLPDGWWKLPAVTGAEGVVNRPGYLLNRKESPFYLINMDDYEVIR